MEEIEYENNSDIIEIEINEKINEKKIYKNQKLESFTLNIIQKECMEKFYENYMNEKMTIIMPCGSGKTLIIYKIIRHFNFNKILIFVPSILLVEQISEIFNGNVIKNYQRKDVTNYKEGIMISTYTSLENISELNFDIIIYDEAHKTCAKFFKNSLNIKSNKKIFLTATKKILIKGREKVCDMSDENIYGKTIYNAGISKGIKSGVLSEFEIYNFNQNNTERHDIENVVKNCIEKLGRKKIVIFNKNVDESIENTIYLYKEKYNSYHIDGSMKIDEKNINIQSFKSENITILNNVDILKEGIDIKEIDCIIFNSIRKSEIELVQILGRGMRLSENKDKLIVITLSINDKSNELNVLVANLIENDEFYIQNLNMIIGKIKCFDILEDKFINYNKELTIKMTDKFTAKNVDTFEENLNSVMKFIEEHKFNPRLNSKDPYEHKLGSWICHWGDKYRKNKISKGRLKLLNDVGFKFGLSREDNLKKHIRNLSEYYEKYENYPSRTNKNKKKRKIGLFVNRMRTLYQRKKLSDKKLEELKKSGFLFKKPDSFKINIEKLKKFIKKNNRYPFYRNTYKYKDGSKADDLDEKEKQLRGFVDRTRIEHAKKKLSDEREKILAEMNFEF
jgi:superfamily II DNA or RNA helicase